MKLKPIAARRPANKRVRLFYYLAGDEEPFWAIDYGPWVPPIAPKGTKLPLEIDNEESDEGFVVRIYKVVDHTMWYDSKGCDIALFLVEVKEPDEDRRGSAWVEENLFSGPSPTPAPVATSPVLGSYEVELREPDEAASFEVPLQRELEIEEPEPEPEPESEPEEERGVEEDRGVKEEKPREESGPEGEEEEEPVLGSTELPVEDEGGADEKGSGEIPLTGVDLDSFELDWKPEIAGTSEGPVKLHYEPVQREGEDGEGEGEGDVYRLSLIKDEKE